MKSVMYHYILRSNNNLRYLNFLKEDNFLKQLNYFKNNFKFFDCNQLFYIDKPIKNSIFLTFDDGLKCHYKISKILKKEGINGILYSYSNFRKTKNFKCTQNTFNFGLQWTKKII